MSSMDVYSRHQTLLINCHCKTAKPRRDEVQTLRLGGPQRLLCRQRYNHTCYGLARSFAFHSEQERPLPSLVSSEVQQVVSVTATSQTAVCWEGLHQPQVVTLMTTLPPSLFLSLCLSVYVCHIPISAEV